MTQAGLVFTMLPKLTPQLLQSSCLSLLPSSPEVSSNFCNVSKTWILICQGVFMTNLPFWSCHSVWGTGWWRKWVWRDWINCPCLSKLKLGLVWPPTLLLWTIDWNERSFSRTRCNPQECYWWVPFWERVVVGFSRQNDMVSQQCLPWAQDGGDIILPPLIGDIELLGSVSCTLSEHCFWSHRSYSSCSAMRSFGKAAKHWQGIGEHYKEITYFVMPESSVHHTGLDIISI